MMIETRAVLPFQKNGYVVGCETTRQAVVKHLKALVDAGLAEPQRIGREVKYAATPEPLTTVVAWLTESSRGWDRRTARLASVSRRLASDRRR